MPGLRDIQGALGDVILRQGEEAIVGDLLVASENLRIHRNHYVASLTEALKSIYPVVCRLVDQRFFAFAADGFIAASPPRQPCLFEYGEGFPDFLAAFPACAALPYLADVGRLEWAINAALHSPLDPPFAPAKLAGIPATAYPSLRFGMQPSLRLLTSAWPVDRIWLSNQPDAAEGEAIELTSGGCRLEVRQQGDTVVFRRLTEAEHTLRAGLMQGRTLEEVTVAVLAVDPLVDLAAALRDLLDEGLIVGAEAHPKPSL